MWEGACDAWRAMRLLEGSAAGFPEKNFWNGAIWCVLEHIFINFLPSKSLKISFYTKVIINCSHVLYMRAIYNVFDTFSPLIFLLIYTFLYKK